MSVRPVSIMLMRNRLQSLAARRAMSGGAPGLATAGMSDEFPVIPG